MGQPHSRPAGNDRPGQPYRPDAIAAVTRRRALGSLGALAGAAPLVVAGCAPGQVFSGRQVRERAPAAGNGPRPTVTARPTPAAIMHPAAPLLPGRLLFVSDANIWLLERNQPRQLTPDRISRQPSWSRDGRNIALVKLATSGADLWTMDADGGNSVALTNYEARPDPQQRHVLRPLWWPDGTRIIYLTEDGSQDNQLWQLTLTTRQRQRFLPPIADRQGGVDSPKLSPDGRMLIVTSFQPGRGRPGRPQLWRLTLPSGSPRQLTEAPDGAYDPAWSPDGRRIAYTVRSAGRHDLWMMNADGSGARQVTTTGVCRAPAWSPDGAWIAYLSGQSGTFEVWAVAAPPDQPSSEVPAAAAVTARSAFRPVTRGALVEATSGLAWAP